MALNAKMLVALVCVGLVAQCQAGILEKKLEKEKPFFVRKFQEVVGEENIEKLGIEYDKVNNFFYDLMKDLESKGIIEVKYPAEHEHAKKQYVLIDWHYTSAQAYTSQAVDFFKKISAECKDKCNCLYETWNEPTQDDWSSKLKPYHEEVIKAIRENDPDGVVIVGTPNWDQDVDKAAADPITDQKNIMYTLHFYAGEPAHDDPLRQKAEAAIKAGLPLFVTEYGTTPASGDGTPNLGETQKWYDLLDQYKVSYINWAIDSKSEQSSALSAGATPADVCANGKDSQSGAFVKKMLLEKNPKPKGCPASRK